MTKENLKKIFVELSYPTDDWTRLEKISRINLTTNGNLFNESGRERSEYFFDTTENLLYKRLVNSKNEVIKYSAIVDVSEIISVEILSAYSESMFNGNSLLRW